MWDPRSKQAVIIDFGLSEIETDENGTPLKMADNDMVKKIADL